MKNTNTGGPAFATHDIHTPETGWIRAQAGMTLRDYFASQALTGAQIWDAVLNGKESSQFAGNIDNLAEIAYAVADAMLKAREA